MYLLKEIASYFLTSIHLSKYIIESSNPLGLLSANVLNPLTMLILSRRRTIQSICSRLVKDTTLNIKYGERRVKITVPDYRSIIIMTPRYEYEEYLSILKAIKRLKIARFDVVVSAGAHIGKWIFQIDGLYDLFLAVEPNPITFYYLVRNIRNNKIRERNVIAVRCGLSSNNGYLPFEFNPYKLDTARVSERGTLKIPVYTLDYLIKRVISHPYDKLMLIILDVEGHEKPVLEGAMETLKRNKVLLYVEIEVERENPWMEREILVSLYGLGYRLIHRRVHVTYKRRVSRCILANFAPNSSQSCTNEHLHAVTRDTR